MACRASSSATSLGSLPGVLPLPSGEQQLGLDVTRGAGWARRGVTRVLRVVRLVRVFRIMKVGVRYKKIRIIANVVKDTMEILWLLVLLVALAGAPAPLCNCDLILTSDLSAARSVADRAQTSTCWES